jgi:hypothetical protein
MVANWGGAVSRAAKERNNNEIMFLEVLTDQFKLNRMGKWKGWMNRSNYEAQLDKDLTQYCVFGQLRKVFRSVKNYLI